MYCVLSQLSHENECEGVVLPDGALVWKRARAKTIQGDCIGSTQSNLLSIKSMLWVYHRYMPGRLRVTDSRMYGGEICFRWALAWPLIHSRDSLLAHGLTVKLSQCLCSNSSPAGWIAALSACGSPTCGHFKWNLLYTRLDSPRNDAAPF